MSEVKEHLSGIFSSNFNYEEALNKLNPRKSGKGLTLDCPACGEPEAFIQDGWDRIQCNRKDKCGKNTTVWDYIQETEGLSQQETLERLAKFSDYPLPQLKTDSETLEVIRKRKENCSLMEEAFHFFREELFKPAGRDVLNYLKGRSYTDKEIEDMELGFFSSRQTLIDYLVNKGHTEDFIREAGLLTQDFGEIHILTIPQR